MLSDFSLMKNINQIVNTDNFEGDFKYLANEVLYINNTNIHTLDLKKADIFALGTTLIDILTRKLIRGQLAV